MLEGLKSQTADHLEEGTQNSDLREHRHGQYEIEDWRASAELHASHGVGASEPSVSEMRTVSAKQ